MERGCRGLNQINMDFFVYGLLRIGNSLLLQFAFKRERS
jgi:hypothetical protein